MVLVYSGTASAQELTMASITEVKSNAEWLKSSSNLANIKNGLSNYDKSIIDRTLSDIELGKTLSIVGISTLIIPYVNVPISLSAGLFGRIPAGRRLTKFIDLKSPNGYLDSSKFSAENFRHLLEAKRQLELAQINSILSVGLQIVGVFVISNLSDEGFLMSAQLLGIMYIPATINTVAVGFNLYRLYKAGKSLRKIH